MSQRKPPEACGCCEPQPFETPGENPPGQPEIRFRLTTHAGFFGRMTARLARWTLPDGEHMGTRPLARLATRARDDFAIAFLDGWATVLEVLDFYQERIANESFLRTATERRSVLELARAIGYELRPGVAASTWLAFTLDSSDHAPSEVLIPAGTPVRSIPQKEGERPHTFETSEDLLARPEWNAMRPRLARPQSLTLDRSQIWLKGANLGISIGDRMLLVQKVEPGAVSAVRPKRVRAIQVDKERDVTRVDLEELPSSYGALAISKISPDNVSQVRGSPRTATMGIEWMPEEDAVLGYRLHRLGWTREDWSHYVDVLMAGLEVHTEVFIFRQRCGIFGHNAPLYASLSERVQAQFYNWDLSGWSVWKNTRKEDGQSTEYTPADLYLERSFPSIAWGSWLLLEGEGLHDVFRITGSVEQSLVGFGMSTRVTGLKLKTPQDQEIHKDERFDVRTTSVFFASERLVLAEEPVESPVEGNTVALARPVTGLEPGRWVWISGELAEPPYTRRSEVRAVASLVHRDGVTTLTFDRALEHRYHRESVVLNANVVSATHGETVEEVLGSGDGSRPFQQFRLRRPPLTYISAPTPSGGRSTLTVRVNGMAWREVPSFLSQSGEVRCYTLRHDDEGNAFIQFGDGQQGARLPTGRENVTARYRSGIGLEGQVAAGSLTQLPQRPLGVKGVTNPLEATGAADPETLAQARRNAPLTVLSLDRIVSLKDYENFARAFAGIGKARADVLWQGEQQVVHLTLARADGKPLTPDSALYRNLQAAIEGARDRRCEVVLNGFQEVRFGLSARLTRDQAYAWKDVEEAVRKALLAVFSFEAREFGQSVTMAEIVAVIHRVPGVRAVDVDRLYRLGEPARAIPPAVLPAYPVRLDGGKMYLGELLLLHPQSIMLTEMAS